MATAQALGVVTQGSTRKVCQLIGDTDFETRAPTHGLTKTNYDVDFTDLGYPVQQGGRTWFFFGDMSTHGDLDPLGFSEETPGDGSRCPTLKFATRFGDAASQAVTLDGLHLATEPFDALEPSTAEANRPFLATATIENPRAFHSLRSAPLDADHFLVVAPWIAADTDASVASVVGALPPRDADSSGKVLLVWGTGQKFRKTGAFFGAVRTEHVVDPTKWIFFSADPNDPSAPPWSNDPAKSTAVVGHQCVGELSVSFDRALHEWRMVYACSSGFFSPSEVPEEVRAKNQTIVVMRTSEQPQGLWSDAKLLFVPKVDGQPSWGDVGPGNFYHRANQRIYRDPNRNNEFSPILGDGTSTFPTNASCAESFPSYCTGVLVQDEFDAHVGCCTRSDVCCDFAFDQIGYTGLSPHFSWGDGNVYAPYLIQGWTHELGTPVVPGYPQSQRLFWTASTLNPYVVDLMSTDVTYDDLDHDGVKDAEDNCPITWNPGQENCNADAEDSDIARGISVKKLGDACDPVPCPDSKTDVVRIETVIGNASTCGTNPYSPSVCVGRFIRDEIDLAPVGAGIDETQLSQQVTAPRPTVPDPGVETESRFCQINKEPPNDFNCGDLKRMGDAELRTWPSAAAEEKTPDHLWHRISLSKKGKCRASANGTCAGVFGDRLPIGASFPLDYGTQQATVKWRYQEDYDFWMGKTDGVTRIPAIPQQSLENGCANVREYGDGTCLDGRLWLHGGTLLGWTTSVARDGTNVGLHGPELPNHYIDNAPDQAFLHVYGGLRARQLFFIAFTLPDPAPGWLYSAGVSLPLIRDDGHVVAVFEDGHHEISDFVAGDDLRAKLLDPNLNWLWPAEPSPFSGGLTSPVGIALTRDGADIASIVVRGHEGQLLEAGGDGGGICIPGVNGDNYCPPSTRKAARIGSVAASRSGHGVYSRVNGRVYVVGGRDAAGALLDQVAIYRLDLATWDRIRLPQHLGDVVSATYSWRDGRLWVIDHDPAETTNKTTRLLWIEPTTGDMHVVARAIEAPAPKYDSRGVFLDLDGNIGIFASSERAQKHRIGMLREVPGGFDVRMTLRRNRALSAQPIVDLRGVALYYEPDNPAADPSREPADDPVPIDRTRAASRMRELPLQSATLGQLGELLR